MNLGIKFESFHECTKLTQKYYSSWEVKTEDESEEISF